MGKIFAGAPMTAGAPWKHILYFTVPILFGSLLQQFYQTADTLIVGNFAGEQALSAVGTTNTVTFLFLAGAIGFSAGNGVVIAQHFGANLPEKMHRDAAGGLFFMLILGAVFSIIGIAAARWVYTYLLKVPPEILEITLEYFSIYCCGLVFQYAYNSVAAILRAVGDSAVTLWFLLIASVINILLDLVFVAVFHCGAAGAAWATDIAQALAAAAAWYYMYRKYPVFRCRIRELVWDNEVIRETVKIGLPIALQFMFIALGLTFIQRAVNTFSLTMTAAYTVGQRIEMYMHMPCNALQTALATFTGQNIGAGRIDRVKLAARQGTVMSLVLTVMVSAAAWLAADVIPGWFALSGEAAGFCKEYLGAMAFIVLILSLYVPLFGIFQGTRHSMIPTVAALCALSLRVAVTYIFKDSSFIGYQIFWWNGVFGFSLGCIIAWSCYCCKIWQKNSSVH